MEIAPLASSQPHDLFQRKGNHLLFGHAFHLMQLKQRFQAFFFEFQVFFGLLAFIDVA